MDILSIALTTLIVLVVAHFCVYYVVRTLYPPAPAPVPVPAPQIVKTNVDPPKVNSLEQQHVSIPTYETPVSMDTTREEGSTNLENLLQDPSIQRDTRVDSPQS